MSQVAPEECVSVVAVEGFEPLFEGDSDTRAIPPQDTPTNTGTIDVTVTGTPSGWTLRMASEKLGVSVNTIRKRIKDRELHGFKVLGPNGPEWRITPPADTVTSTPPLSVTVTDTPPNDVLVKVIESQGKQLEALAEQLKAASQVIMYQRDQLEEKDHQIKLLTDRRHKDGWWRRLWQWTSGRRTCQ